jgi:hypothetical protein
MANYGRQEQAQKAREEACALAAEKVRENFERYVAKFDDMVAMKKYGDGEFDINIIEAIWGEIIQGNNKITEELIGDVVAGITEKELIVKKKQEIRAAGEGVGDVRNGGKQVKTIQTIFGIITIIRSALKPEKRRCTNRWCKKARVKERIPLDEFLGLDDLPYKMTRLAMLKCARYGQQMPYKTAEQFLQEDVGMQVSASTIEKVTDYIGEKVHEEDKARAEESEANRAKIDWKDGRDGREGVFYFMPDGSMVNTRKEDEGARKEDKNESSWKEVKLGVMFAGKDARVSDDEKRIKIKEKNYVPCVGNATEFAKYVFDEAIENHAFEYENVVMVSDGATWIRKLGEDIFPGCVQILDFYHLAENIYSFGKYLFNNDEKKYTPWAEGLLYLLKNSRTAEALEKLKEFSGKTYSDGIVNPHTYITNNLNKVDYAEYKRLGYYIGSGPIECGNKSVVQKRCKQAGMRWNVRTLQGMVTLRSKWESGTWGSSVRDFFLKSA